MVKVITPAPAAPASASGPTETTTTATPKPGSGVRPPVPPRAPKDSKRTTKVLLTVSDGAIDWATMSPAERKKFEELFKDPDFLRAFGLTGKAVEAFTEEQMAALYDGVSMAYATVAKMFYRWPPAALQFLAYTPEQKKLLSKPTADVLNRFAPKLLMENKELFIFATVFLGCTQQNFMKAKQVATEELKKAAEAKKEAERNSPHATAAPAPGAPGNNGHGDEPKITILPPTAAASHLGRIGW